MKKLLGVVSFFFSAVLHATINWSTSSIVPGVPGSGSLYQLAYPICAVAVNSSNNAVGAICSFGGGFIPLNFNVATYFLRNGNTAWSDGSLLFANPPLGPGLSNQPPYLQAIPPIINIAIDDTGRSALVMGWAGKPPVASTQQGYVYLSIYNSASFGSGHFSTPVQIDSFTTPVSGHFVYPSPQVAMDNNGQAYIVWNAYNSGTGNIEVRTKTYNFTTGLTSGVTVLDSTPASYGAAAASSTPQIAISTGSGTGVAVWDLNVSGNWEVRSSTFTTSVPPTWSGVSTIDTGGTTPNYPSVAITSTGTAMAVWGNSSSFVVNTATSSMPGTWGAPSPLSSAGLYSPWPKIAIDSNSNAVAIWNQCTNIPTANSRSFTIQSSVYKNSGMAWSPASAVSSPITMQLYYQGAGLGSPTEYNPYLTPAVQLSIQKGATQNIAAVWQQYDTSPTPPQAPPYAQPPYFNVVSSSLAPITSSSSLVWQSPVTISSYLIATGDSGGLFPTYPVLAFDSAFVLWSWSQNVLNGTTILNQFSTQGAIGIPVNDPNLPVITGGSGTQLFQRFPGQGDLVNYITWNGSSLAATYNIYIGSMDNWVATTTNTNWYNHQVPPNQSVTYLITGVTSSSVEGLPFTLVVPPSYPVPSN